MIIKLSAGVFYKGGIIVKKICGLITAAVLVTATAVTSFTATDNVTVDINKISDKLKGLRSGLNG